MNTHSILLALGLAFVGGAVSTGWADTSWSVGISVNQVGDFYEPLGAYGYWVDLPAHGRCWYPAYIGRDWRPYGTGHWEWTDQGWYWVSDEPWGWATYHYGRWVYDAYYGWVWVPGLEWAPAWVSWREGGGYVGWAPLPPAGHFAPHGMLVVEHFQYEPHWWVFVEHRHFCGRHRPSTVIVNNTTIINKTVNITKVEKVVNNNNTVIINNGPDVAVIEKTAPQRIQRVAAADLWRERSEHITQRASREGVKPPPVGNKPPVGLRTAQSEPPAPARLAPTLAPEGRRAGRERPEPRRDTAPPAVTRGTDKPAPASPSPADNEPPKVQPRPEPSRPGPAVEPSWPRKPDRDQAEQPRPERREVVPAPRPNSEPPVTAEPRRRRVSPPEPGPSAVPHVEPPSTERREYPRRDRREPGVPSVPRNQNSGNFYNGQVLPPARPAPAASVPTTSPEPTDSPAEPGRSRDRDKDKEQEKFQDQSWPAYREPKRRH